MKNSQLLILLLALLSFESCSSGNKSNIASNDSVFATGKILGTIRCRFDQTQSYALYLPSHYSSSKKWPVIYAFDPHGCGMLPVELFKDEAEKYGYIIIGSNNSKNGIAWNITSEICDTLFSDTHRRFSIDNNRIYTAGFSGGSRVASTLAITKGGINSVIGCGAGLGSNEQPRQKFSYYGMAGNSDMNMTEMIQLDSIFEKAGFRHHFESFEGKHAWPSKHAISDAFLWLELNAIKDKQIPKNDTLVNQNYQRQVEKYKALLESKKYYEAAVLGKKIICFYEELIDVSAIKQENANLAKNPAVIQAKKHLVEISKKEIEMQSFYGNAIPSQKSEWWKSQVNTINQKINTTTDKEEKFMYKRLLGYLSLAAYMNINGALKAERMDFVEHFNMIYTLVDPENPEHAYVSATLAMKHGNAGDAIVYLQKACDLGFAEWERLEKDPVMNPLRTHANYGEIIKSIKNNATTNSKL